MLLDSGTSEGDKQMEYVGSPIIWENIGDTKHMEHIIGNLSQNTLTLVFLGYFF